MSWQPGQTIEDLERDAIKSAMKFFQGNKTAVANALGVTVKTIYNKLEQYDIERADREKADKQREEAAKKEIFAARHGLHVEPPREVPEKQPVLLRQQEKVQEMPPARHASGNAKGSR